MGSFSRKIIFASSTLLFSTRLLAAPTLMDCAKIDDVNKRVACYDELAGRVKEKLQVNEPTGTTRQRKAQEQAETQKVINEVIGEDSHDTSIARIEIKSVTRDFAGRTIFATTDGRYFRRETTAPVSFRKGDNLKIEDGIMGAIFLVRDDGLRIKVKELQ